jgi:sec-independent protein translocase protein TatB
MFDIGWQEIFILAVIALIVIGPKDLPSAVKTITRGLRKARSLARDLRDGMDDVVREAEMEDFANTISGEGVDLTQKFKDAANIDFDDIDIEGDLREEMTGAAEDINSLTKPKDSDKKEKGGNKKGRIVHDPGKVPPPKSAKADR